MFTLQILSIKPADCNDSCQLLQISIDINLILVNLEARAAQRLNLILLGVLVAHDGDLYQIKLLLLGRLDGEQADSARDRLVALLGAIGSSVKGSIELGQAVNGSLSYEDDADLLISGSFSNNRNSVIEVRALVQFLVSWVQSASHSSYVAYEINIELGPRICGRPQPRSRKLSFPQPSWNTNCFLYNRRTSISP